MNERVKMIVAGVVGLVVGGGAGGFWGMMQVDEKQQQLVGVMSEKDAAQAAVAKLKRDVEDAPRRWGKDLGRLVMAAVPDAAAPAAAAPAAPAAGQPAPAPAAAPAADDPARTLDAARAVLAQRDTFRSSLEGVRAQLGGDMDALAIELGNATPDMDKIRALLGNLKANWTGTEKELENVTRRLFADMGLG
ncbi:MAG: hypothetical protein ACREUW_13885, partial [Burkholderiales bacterium]